MTMLRLSRRTCKIGTGINTRRELHGEDPVAALDIPLGDVMLTAEELNALLREPHAHQMFFNSRDALVEPAFPTLKAFRFAEKIEPVSVELELSSQTTVKLTKCTLARIELEPRPGGLTAMSVQVQCVPKLDSSIARLLEKLDCEVGIVIEQQQGELDLKGDKDAKPAKANGHDAKGADADTKAFEAGAKRKVAEAVARVGTKSAAMKQRHGPRRT